MISSRNTAAGSRRGVQFHLEFSKALTVKLPCLGRFQGNEFSFRLRRHGAPEIYTQVPTNRVRWNCVRSGFINPFPRLTFLFRPAN